MQLGNLVIINLRGMLIISFIFLFNVDKSKQFSEMEIENYSGC